MNIHFKWFVKPGKSVILLLCLFLYSGYTFSQVRVRSNPSVTLQRSATVTDTTRVRRIISRDNIRVNDTYIPVLNSVDTVYSAAPFLQSKKACEFDKSLDNDGCVVIKYADGLTKKICDGYVTEVIMPNGKKHVIRVMKLDSYVMKIPPPPNPSQSDNSFKWLSGYSAGLMKDIKDLLTDNRTLQDYVSRERATCNGSIYKEIEYRTIFLQEYLKAK